MTIPKAFISYSWDDEAHKEWVAELAATLRGDGVETILDQWHAVPGDQLPSFMEREIRENEYVLIICTPNYRLKSDERKGGVGYEGDIMTAEVHTLGNHRKFIPVLARGKRTKGVGPINHAFVLLWECVSGDPNLQSVCSRSAVNHPK